MARRASTLHEVAKLAGVSTATVSRVVHNMDNVSSKTRDRVLDAINKLDYRPSHVGRALATRQHDTLGFIVPGLVGPYFAEVVHGCTEVCSQVRKSVIVFATHLLPNLDEQILDITGRVDGLAVCGGTIQPDLLKRLRDTGIPLVLLSQHPDFDIPTVRVDNITETKALVHHLIEDHNYTRFDFAGSFRGSPDAEDRWNAVVEGISAAGLTPPSAPIPAGFDLQAGAGVARHLLSKRQLPDVLICGNDEIAISTMGALKAHGVRIPDHLAITGWDDITIAAHTTPALTTVRQFTRSLGQHVAQTLISLINGDDVPGDHILPSKLMIRDSCGCTPTIPTHYASPEPVNGLM